MILASSHHPLREPFAGGLEAFTWGLARGLRQRDITVSIFAAPGSDAALDVHELAISPVVLSDTARSDPAMVPEALLEEHYAYLQVMLQLQGRADVDVVHNNSVHYLPIALAATLPAPMLTTLHTPPTPWMEPAVRLMARRRERFVAVSAFTSRQWTGITPSGVVPNGIDLDHWPAGPGGPDLVWFGRLVPEKAPDQAVLIARAAGRRVRLAGPIEDMDYFDSTIRPLLDEQAEYVGHLARGELAALVGGSAATVVTPAWDEPYGLVAAESMACGTPVVAYHRGGLGEFVGPDSGRLVEPGDVQGAARMVEEAMGLSRRRCREHAVRVCSLERMIDAYVDIYAAMSAPSAAR